MNSIEYVMMMDFLEKYCPVAKVKLNKNDRQFTRSLVINGAFINSKSRAYPMSKKNQNFESIVNDLKKTLKNVFSFPDKEISIVVSKYLEDY